MTLAASSDIWRFQFHPEVWIIIFGGFLLAFYAVKIVGPNAVQADEPIYTRTNSIAFIAAMFSLWFASDWPMHDISEEYLYSAHMLQHLIISLIVPPLLLLAFPNWLARLLISPTGKTGKLISQLTRPVVAGFVYNFVIIVTHLPFTVNYSIENGPFHYFVHLIVFFASLWMWIPVMSPLPELRKSLPAQMVYLFLMSVIPTVPAGFLTFAGGALYDAYDHSVRLWGIDITTDQQLAGLVMKLIGGIYLWVWIGSRFFQWSRKNSPEMVLVDSQKQSDLKEKETDINLKQ